MVPGADCERHDGVTFFFVFGRGVIIGALYELIGFAQYRGVGVCLRAACGGEVKAPLVSSSSSRCFGAQCEDASS